jgi:hypothetical protein
MDPRLPELYDRLRRVVTGGAGIVELVAEIRETLGEEATGCTRATYHLLMALGPITIRDLLVLRSWRGFGGTLSAEDVDGATRAHLVASVEARLRREGTKR